MDQSNFHLQNGNFYLHKYALGPATVLADGLLAVGGVENLIGWDAGVGHTFLSSQHPYDNIRHTVLRLYCEYKQTRECSKGF